MTGTATSTDAWVRRFHPADDAGTRLICFPHAGGSATYYFPVSRAMSPATDVLAVQYPGRQDRRFEPCVDDLHELADRVVAELLPWTDRPVALFGHSLGATLAFEVALRLEAAGIVPLGLFASGRTAPSRHRGGRMHLNSDEKLLDSIKRMSGTDPQILQDDELLQVMLPMFRSDYKAAETYRYRSGSVLSCPVIALTGDSDTEVTPEEARAWEEHTTGPFSMEVFSGGHFYLNSHAGTVISLIRDHMANR
ncbi:alpha/beta fold hydrolase [Streptomyces sp. NPDC046203]|uniref:thioesterase II family protein n=1 Tax=Streptomyces sp. NPDC046203 TaxID=3154602 RepID=UPI0033D250ED